MTEQPPQDLLDVEPQAPEEPQGAAKAAAPVRLLRIVAKIACYPPVHNSGAEWMLHPMLAALAARGHTVEAHLSRHEPGHREPWELDGVQVFPDGLHPAGHPDVYVSQLRDVPATAARARGYGVPLVVIQHGTLHPVPRDRVRANPHLTVFNSEWMATQSGNPERSITVHPPVFAEAYQTEPGTAVTMVNLTASKGAGLFWEVAKRMPETEFLAAQGWFGEQDIRDLPNVTVLEHMDGRQMRDEVYARTRILLVPSQYESWGRVATEAMCSGIPVIAHRAEGGLAENLGSAAIWADRGKPEEWVRQIRRLSKPEAWQKASQAARKRYAELDPAGELETWCRAVEALAA